jgi:prophage regulatory protein
MKPKLKVAAPAKVDRIFKAPEAAEKIGVSRASLYRFVKLGLLPRPRKTGLRASGWLESELDAFLEAGVQRAELAHAARLEAQAIAAAKQLGTVSAPGPV